MLARGKTKFLSLLSLLFGAGFENIVFKMILRDDIAIIP